MMRSLRTLAIVAVFICSILFQTVHAQRLTVPFLDHRPVIDGIPDPEILAATTPVPLTIVEKSNAANPDVAVHLRAAYGTDFFYILLEVDADSIVYRDRAYQNGDGFHLTIARPMPEMAPSSEFYVLRCSPGADSLQATARLGVWYYNIDLQGTRLSADARLKTSVRNGKCTYEFLLPWTDVHPYHPFLAPLGFNICFVKAFGAVEKTNFYLAQDPHMQWEGHTRMSMMPDFLVPGAVERPQMFCQLSRSSIDQGATDTLLVSLGLPSATKIQIHAESVDSTGTLLFRSERSFRVHDGLNELAIPLDTKNLEEGSYTLTCTTGLTPAQTMQLTVLPRIDFSAVRASIDRAALAEGSRQTLLFQAQELERHVDAMHPYEHLDALRRALVELRHKVDEAVAGHDPYANKTGIFRRGFLSGVDTTLRPYTVKIPATYDPSKKYPLLVFLHGSGQDDREALDHTALSDGAWIELAPNGRGVSNCFTADHAQEDIEEAIQDVVKNYPIDTTRIVISGFSMGGYGAYRTFYEHPTRYIGVVVFSGHPNLASRWIGEGHPDFLRAEFLPVFKNIPMFIYHNENDRNCPFELTEELIGKLKAAGAAVEAVITKDGGHSLVDAESQKRYFQWLAAQANAPHHVH